MNVRGSARTLKLYVILAASIALLELSWSETQAETRLEIWPLLGITEEYTDNLLFAPINAQRDEVNVGSPGASVALTDQQRHLKLDYLSDWQLYAEHPEFDRVSQDHYVGFTDEERLSGQTDLSLGDTFIKGQPTFGRGLIGSSGVSPQLAQALLQKDFLTNSFYSALHRDFGGPLSASLGAHESFFSSSAASTGESYSQGGNLTVSYKLSRRWAALLGYDFGDFRFSSSPSTETHAPSLGLSFEHGHGLSITGQTGPLIVRSSAGVSMDIGYSFVGTYTRELSVISLSSSRQESTTSGFGGAGVNQSFAGSVSYELARRTGVFANSSYSKVSAAKANSEILSYGTGINYGLNRELSLFAEYLGFETISPRGPAVLTNTIAVGITLSAKPWRWMF